MEIAYAVRAVPPHEHRARFSIDLDGVSSRTLDLVLPSWVPGFYVIFDFSRAIRDLTARREPSGASLATERVGTARWRISTDGASRVHVDYTVYGHQLSTAQEFDLTPQHMFLNPGVCLPYVDGHLSEPATVALDLPADWTVITELEEVSRVPPKYRARNYDDLVDSPIDAGRPVVLTVRPNGIPHRISLCGEGGNYDPRTLEEDISRIVESSVALFGDVPPIPRYTFFVHLTSGPEDGLEHASSTSIVTDRNGFRPAQSYRDFLYLAAHEYFHLYNVKRIRPKVLGPFDYTRENYTRLLWWMEGATRYFSYLVLRRAGVLTAAQYLNQCAKTIEEYLHTPGRNRISLEESSLLAWIEYEQPFEDTPNQSVSYYTKGDLVSMCLDLEIRHQSETRSSLETVLRLLWNEYGKVGRGLEEDELLPIVNRATGLDLGPFFDRYVRGTEELDLAAFVRYAGLVLAPKPKGADEKDEPEAGDLGIAVEDAGGLARVRYSFSGRPGHAAGLTPGDEVIAINDVKVTYANLDQALERCPAGTPLDLTVFRRGYLHRVSLVTGALPPRKYALTPLDSPSELARKVYESWIGTKWVPRPTLPSDPRGSRPHPRARDEGGGFGPFHLPEAAKARYWSAERSSEGSIGPESRIR
jgi:predicted metalloprotease with PDZ domain